MLLRISPFNYFSLKVSFWNLLLSPDPICRPPLSAHRQSKPSVCQELWPQQEKFCSIPQKSGSHFSVIRRLYYQHRCPSEVRRVSKYATWPQEPSTPVAHTPASHQAYFIQGMSSGPRKYHLGPHFTALPPPLTHWQGQVMPWSLLVYYPVQPQTVVGSRHFSMGPLLLNKILLCSRQYEFPSLEHFPSACTVH